VFAVVFERIDEAVAVLERTIASVRDNMSSSTSLVDQKINSVMADIVELLEKISEILRKSKCVVIQKGGAGIEPFCGHWRLIERDSSVILYRLKPASAITYENGSIRFVRDDVKLELANGRLKLCKWNYCKEINPSSRNEIKPIIPQLTYLVREVGWHVSKSLEGLNACIRQTVPQCLRQY